MATDRIQNVPAWVGVAYPISQDDTARLKPLMSSWTKLSKNLGRLSEVDCLKVMLLERMGMNRTLIIHRALARFRTKRQARENQELRRA